MKNFLNSVWFNTIVAALSGFFAVMQEVWLGTDVPVLNLAVLGVFVSCGMSCAASVVNYLVTKGRFNLYNTGIGAAVGIVVTLLTLLLV